MGEGSRRNQLCWCGSGKKFKRCHLGTERSGEPAYRGAVTARRKEFSRRTCLHPKAPDECHGSIVRAHTISRSAGLSHIARDGHVYCFDSDSDKRGIDGAATTRWRGIRQASVFNGFCQYHDSSLFVPIDNQALSFTSEQLFLLAYRGLCRELYLKEGLLRHIEWHLRWIGEDPRTAEQRLRRAQLNESKLGAQRGLADLQAHKGVFDQLLLEGRFSEIESVVFKVDACPPVLSSGAWLPVCDFQGNELQRLDSDEPAEAIITSSVVAAPGGAFVLSWLPGHVSPAQLASSLAALDDEDIPDAIVRFLFESCENLSISPDWWDSLAEPTRAALIARYNASVGAPRPPTALVDDGIRSVDWRVVQRLGIVPEGTV